MLGPLRSLSLWLHRHRAADPFLPSALLARQQPVDAEAAASGHERENEAAHYGEVLVEVVVLRTARGCFGELPVPVRAQGGDDHEQKQQRRADRTPTHGLRCSAVCITTAICGSWHAHSAAICVGAACGTDARRDAFSLACSIR